MAGLSGYDFAIFVAGIQTVLKDYLTSGISGLHYTRRIGFGGTGGFVDQGSRTRILISCKSNELCLKRDEITFCRIIPEDTMV